MKIQEFNKIYGYAKEVDIINDDYMNTMGWFWINLTVLQHIRMYNLMLKQGAKETINAKGVQQITLSNGLGILKL
jgi:hypothetical protein